MKNVNKLLTGPGVASWCAAIVAMGFLLFYPVNGIAQNIVMQDGGSTAILNPGTGSGLFGMNNWDVGSGNQLAQQWFWYTATPVSQTPGVAQKINQISAPSIQTGSGADGINDVLTTYQNSQLAVNVEYVLTGNGVGSGSADLQEFLDIKNTSADTFTLRFYQYSDFNLLGGASDSVSISGSPGGWTGAVQTTGVGGNGLAEVIDTPNANWAEANLANAGVNATMYELNNNANYTLNDVTSAGPGDATWAFEWIATLAPGETLDITKDKGLSIQIVPEPSTVAFIALGLGAWGLARRRQSA